MSRQSDFLTEEFLTHSLRHMREMEQGMPLFECLVALQVRAGLSYEEAEDAASRCIAATAARETLCGQVSGDAMAVMNKFFRQLSGLEPVARMDALYRILFGLTVYDDPASAQKLDAGIPLAEVYDQWLDACALSGARFYSFEALEEEIRQALQRYSLSPAAMRNLTRQMYSGKGCLAAAEAFGQQGRNLKCLMTMETWLRNREQLTMEEAANIAGASAEIQATEDALRRGLLTRDAARKILLAIGIAAIVIGAAIAVYHVPGLLQGLQGAVVHPTPTGIAATAADMAALNALANDTAVKVGLTGTALGGLVALGGGAMTALSDGLADFFARLTHRSVLLRKAAQADTSALEDLAREDTKPPVTVYAQYPEFMNIPEIQEEDPAEGDHLIF